MSAEDEKLIAELSAKLLLGKKTEVFSFLYTLKPERAQMIKGRLISALKQQHDRKGSSTSLPTMSPSSSPKVKSAKAVSSPRTRKKRSGTGSSGSLVSSSSSSAASASPRSSSPSSGSLQRKAARAEKKVICGGRYMLGDDLLGRGQFGRVYKGLDKRTGQFVAIKELDLEEFDEEAAQSISVEADLLNDLQHKNIVEIYGTDEDSTHFYFVMELISTGSLYKTLQKFGSLSEELCVIYIIQVLRGLRYMHRKGVVHGDIKADNILLTRDGKVKLADFGTAALLSAKQETALGTPFWMAPEVISMQGAVPKSDIWSVGCMVIELVNEVPPYYDLGPMTAIFRMVEDDHPPLPEAISPELKDFLQKIFVKDVEQRPEASDLLKHKWITMHWPDGDSGDETAPSPAVVQKGSSDSGDSHRKKKKKKKKKHKSHRTGSGNSSSGKGSSARGKMRRRDWDVTARLEALTDLQVLEYPNGDHYRGQVRNGERHGLGVYRMVNGTTFEGDFVNGKPHGKGHYVYDNGDEYWGELRQDLFHGIGRFKTAAGAVHEGTYRDGKRHGPGKFRAANGSSYVGGYAGDLMEGMGTYRYGTGDVYEGMFHLNKFHGQGTYTFANGTQIKGEFKDGKPVKRGQ